MWHIDSHHKLIRWKIVTHDAVDGYSRVIPYLKVAGNNSSETAFSGFMLGLDRYGLPSRVRCDEGGENVLIAEYMISHEAVSRDQKDFCIGKLSFSETEKKGVGDFGQRVGERHRRWDRSGTAIVPR